MFVQDSSCLLHELSASQLVALVTCSDTGSHNMLDLIQSLVPPHYVCNGYIQEIKLFNVLKKKKYRVNMLDQIFNVSHNTYTKSHLCG